MAGTVQQNRQEAITKTTVQSFYFAAAEADFGAYLRHISNPFQLTAPEFLPWGGTHGGRFFEQEALGRIPQIFDYSRLTFEQFYVQGEEALVIARVGIAGSSETVVLTDQWRVHRGKATALKTRIYEPQALSEQLRIAAAISQATRATPPAEARRSSPQP